MFANDYFITQILQQLNARKHLFFRNFARGSYNPDAIAFLKIFRINHRRVINTGEPKVVKNALADKLFITFLKKATTTRSQIVVALISGEKSYLFFRMSRISASNNSSFVGSGAAGASTGAVSSFFFMLFIPFIIIKMAKAMIRKSTND